MKKLSDELQKSYYILVFIFSFSCLGLLYIFASYMIKVSSADITTTNIFIDYELNEFTEKLEKNIPIDKLFKGALEECPKIDNVFVVFDYNGKIYSNSDIYPKELDLKEHDGIQNIGFYDYQALHRTIYVKGIEPIDLKIIKDLKGDKIIFFRSIGIAGVWIIFTLIIGIYISKKFYNMFIPPLRNIQEITNKINLDSLDADVKTENNFVEFISIIHSYKNMLSRLKKQTDAQIDFVNSASHELKTPITIIGGFIETIKLGHFKDRKQLEYFIDIIYRETQRLNHLINDLLQLSHIENSSKSQKNIHTISLPNTFNTIISLYKNIAIKKDIVINTNIENVSIVSYISEEWLRTVIGNLIDNAIKYSKPSTSVNVIASIKNLKLIISIEDFGCGIEKNELKKIFHRFYRVDKSRNNKIEGTGLGLSIVKNMILNMKGKIKVKSEINKGSTFVITLNILDIK